jgi:hypothetical protein
LLQNRQKISHKCQRTFLSSLVRKLLKLLFLALCEKKVNFRNLKCSRKKTFGNSEVIPVYDIRFLQVT